MKKVFLLSIITAMVVFSGCEKDESNPLLGKWKLIRSADSEMNECTSKSWILFEKTTLTTKEYEIDNGDCVSSKVTFDYSLSGNTITVEGDDDSEDSKVNYSISGDILSIKDDGKELSAFKKVQ